MRKLCIVALAAAAGTGVALAEPPKVKPIFDVRVRWEGLDTPARTAAADRSYPLNLARARVGLDAAWARWTLHGLLQGAAAWDLPENPAFGAGANYLSANGGDTDPSQIGNRRALGYVHERRLQSRLRAPALCGRQRGRDRRRPPGRGQTAAPLG